MEIIKNIYAYVLSAALMLTGCAGTGTEGSFTNGNIENIDNALQVHFIDVDQADCELIKFPDGEYALIDAGGGSTKNETVEYLKNQGIDEFAFVVATHGHEDHIGGMQSVIKNFKIDKIIRSYEDYDSTLYTNFLYAIEEKGIDEVIAKYGDTFEVGGAEFEILAPIGDDYKDYNDYSVVLKMTYKNKSFIFTGDASKASENDMLSMGYDLKSDVLKVGHHGSRTASTEEFIKAVSPSVAVISVGKDNKYGLPDEEPIERLENAGSAIYRTDEVGTVIISTDGDVLNVQTEDGSSSAVSTNNSSASSSSSEAVSSEPKNESQKETPSAPQQIEEFIGNKNTKVYHVPTCSSLPAEKNQVKFSSKEEAESEGYKAHEKCVK